MDPAGTGDEVVAVGTAAAEEEEEDTTIAALAMVAEEVTGAETTLAVVAETTAAAAAVAMAVSSGTVHSYVLSSVYKSALISTPLACIHCRTKRTKAHFNNKNRVNKEKVS